MFLLCLDPAYTQEEGKREREGVEGGRGRKRRGEREGIEGKKKIGGGIEGVKRGGEEDKEGEGLDRGRV